VRVLQRSSHVNLGEEALGPEHSSQLGMVLELSSGKVIPLSAGLPLTARRRQWHVIARTVTG